MNGPIHFGERQRDDVMVLFFEWGQAQAQGLWGWEWQLVLKWSGFDVNAKELKTGLSFPLSVASSLWTCCPSWLHFLPGGFNPSLGSMEVFFLMGLYFPAGLSQQRDCPTFASLSCFPWILTLLCFLQHSCPHKVLCSIICLNYIQGKTALFLWANIRGILFIIIFGEEFAWL